MNEKAVSSRVPQRSRLCSRLRRGMAVLLVLGLAAASAGEPCKPFEGGRVDVRLLEVMRAAAREGRLYRVVPGNSKVGFCVRHFPLQEVHGDFPNIVGGLVMPSSRQRFGQALLLIHTTPMEVNDTELAPLIESHEFMDISNFPEILFIGRAFEWTGPLKGYIYGDLTLRGKTQPVVFDVGIDILEEGIEDERPGRIHLRGTGQVNRYQYDMRSYRFFVSETVRLCLDVELVPWESS